MKPEAWKPVVGFEARYFVSNKGRVVSLRGTIKFLKPGPSGGYPSVCLGRNKMRLVHRLVAEAFLGPCPIGQEVRHKNGRREHASVWNLEYGARQQNVEDTMRQGRVPKGRRHWNWKHGKYAKL